MDIFSRTIEEWYAQHRRDLPWRDTDDPYRIWVSEIILQQTRVEQGLEYYNRFVRRFPDVRSLADADEDEVMRYWQGLGYYSRARHMHAAARSMDGVFPRTYQGVRALQGVGAYTAAAVCSLAYHMPYAVVDGNVYRVLARYLGVELPIDTAAGRKAFEALAEELLDRRDPALYNQAIMDFGALQCVPRSPRCGSCPLAGRCVASSRGIVDLLPVKVGRIRLKERYFSYIYVHAGDCTYIRKRTGNDIWKNLYELPLVETGRPLSEDELRLSPQFRALFPDAGLLSFRRVCGGVRHVLSHRIIHADFYEAVLREDDTSLDASYQRVRADHLGDYAVSRLIQLFLEEYHGSLGWRAGT